MSILSVYESAWASARVTWETTKLNTRLGVDCNYYGRGVNSKD